MKHFLRIILEGAIQAWQQLTGNKLRSFLSLLGITIGIVCIIGVKSAVDSLEANIRGSMQKLGEDVIYVEKFSWAEDPGQNYWKWMRRPNFKFREYETLKDNLELAERVGFWEVLGAKTVKWQSSNAESVFFLGITEECSELFHLEFQGEGRFISPSEYHNATDVCIVGASVSKQLFGENIDPLDKEISVSGHKLRIIGVLKESGKDLIKPFAFDECVLVGYNFARRGFGVRGKGGFDRTSLLVQAKQGVDIETMKDEIVGNLRSKRGLKPLEENNFSMNTLSILSGLFDTVFSTINTAGLFIGIFALLVGMFSVANIMFVSVRERTSLIGIKMALGAKRWFILLEILIEGVALCLLGGLTGLLFIWLLTLAISKAIDFNIFLSFNNILFGLLTSVIVGILSGLIPAYQASKLDPVEAIRK